MVFRNSTGFIPSGPMAFTAADLPARSKTLTSGRINVLFFWQHDRWFHSLHVCQPDGTRAPASWQTALPVSDDDPHWPSSPPLMEIAEVAGPHGTALVGLGKAGGSHYSMSVTAGSDGSLIFECACRLTTRPGWLGSAYVRANSVATGSLIVIKPLRGSSAEVQTARAQAGAQNHRLRISPSSEHDIRLAGQERPSTGPGGLRLFGPANRQHACSEGFFPGPPAAYDGRGRPPKGGATIQWSYQAHSAESG
jgi:hypothetical protein